MTRFLRRHLWLRRTLVATMYGAYLAGGLIQWHQHAVVTHPTREIVFCLFVLAFVVGVLVFVGGGYGRLGMGKDQALDERERAVRHRIYARAYGWLGGLSILGGLWWQMGPLVGQLTPLGVDSNVAFWGYVLLVVTLPSVMLVWSDKPVDED